MTLPEDDRGLYELVLDLQARSVTTQRLEPIEGDHASVLEELNVATEELKERGLPRMHRRDGVYVVDWAEPHGNSVTFRKDPFPAFDEAYERAKALQKAFEDLPGYP